MARLDLGTVREAAETFAERDDADSESYPSANLDDLWEMQLFQAPYPEALGGSDWSVVECADATEAVAVGSPSTALLLIMPLGLAGVTSIPDDATPEAHRDAWATQREQIAADYARRRFYAACNSERGAGGSLEATQTVAERTSGDSFAISGTKILSSGGLNADVFFSSAKVTEEDLPGSGIVEFFPVERNAPGVEVAADWDGFGMRSTESQTVHYQGAQTNRMLGFPDFLASLTPTTLWYCLMPAISLGAVEGILRLLGDPAPQSPALRLRLAEAQMRVEAMRAYMREVAGEWHAAAAPEFTQRVVRMKTYITSESTKLAAELFSLGGGRHYRRDDQAARFLRDSFAGTALRPPLGATLDTLAEEFSV